MGPRDDLDHGVQGRSLAALGEARLWRPGRRRHLSRHGRPGPVHLGAGERDPAVHDALELLQGPADVGAGGRLRRRSQGPVRGSAMGEGPLTGLRRAAALGAAALVVGAEVAAPAGATWLSALDAAVAVAFAGGAAAVAPVSGRTADLALAVAVTWGLGTIAAGGDLPAELVLLHRAPLAVLVVTYPGRRVRAAEPVATGTAAVLAAVP